MADIETEREMSRSEVAEYLRTFADELDARSGSTEGIEASDRAGTNDRREGDTRSEGTGAGANGNVDTTEDSEPGATDTSSDDTGGNTSDGAIKAERRNEEPDAADSGRGESNGSDRSGGRVTFMIGNESTTINPPETVTFEVSVDSDSALIGTGTGRTARFALHWDEADVEDDENLSIR